VGESPPSAIAGTLQSLVSRLCRIGVRLRSRDGGYVLEAEPDDVDAVRFERLVGGGRSPSRTRTRRRTPCRPR
jgi:hypothetical protein